ncbi:MAG: baseplate J/gp47 family protein [Peptococcaceae bacterium]
MIELPEFLQEQTEEKIRQRMLEQVPGDLDKTEGGFIFDALSPAAIELAQAAIWAREVLRRGFAGTAASSIAGEKTRELSLRAEEHGLARRPAVAAEGYAVFTGTAGTIIPAGTQMSTASTETRPAIFYATKEEAAIGDSGSIAAAIEALEPGQQGNAAAHTVRFFVTKIAGINSVDNLEALMGGLDEEDDLSLLARYLQKVRSPSAGGNRADYVNWALEVPGVGGVSVIPVRDGAGTVSVAIIDDKKEPAGQELVDKVQDYIAPLWNFEKEAEAMSWGENGTSLDETLDDDRGNAVRMIYSPEGPGTIIQEELAEFLSNTGRALPGIWRLSISVKVDHDDSEESLLQFGIWNNSAGTWAGTNSEGGNEAVTTLTAAELSSSFAETGQEFYWNGLDQVELRISRLQADQATTLWVDRASYRSTFSSDTGEGKAPVGAKVTVEPAEAVLINVSAVLTIAEGYHAESIKASVEQNIEDYVRSTAFQDDNDVRYVRIGQAILDTTGVKDYDDLLVNGQDGNIEIGSQQVALKGTVSLT